MSNQKSMQKQSMSKQSMSKQSIAKPFCKVCHDAGKTVAEYSTHYVRESRGGAVVCPTILNQQCKYCKKHGHTPSHCPALQAKHVQAKQVQAHEAQPIQAHEAKQVQAHEAKQVQAQARLCEPPRLENKISAPVIKPVALKMNSWASVVGKKPGQVQEQAQEEQAQEPEEQAQEPEEQAQEEPEEAQEPEEQAQEPEEQAQAPEEQAQEPQEEQSQAPAFNYSNMDWADVE